MTAISLFTLCFCCGIVLCRCVYLPAGPLYAGLIIVSSSAVIFIKSRLFIILACLLAIGLGSLVFINTRILSGDHIAKITPYDPQEAILTGVVCEYPQAQRGIISFVLSSQRVIIEEKDYKVTGRVMVKAPCGARVAYGQRLRIKGKVSRPYVFGGNKYYREYLKRRGIYTVLNARKVSGIVQLGGYQGNIVKALAFKLRSKAHAALFEHIPFTQAALLSAMILGDRSSIPEHLNKMFIQTGTVHMLAISGFNVGIVALVLELVLKAFRIKRKIRYVLLLCALLFYCLLTGAYAPVVRSSIMAGALLTAYFLKRELNILNSISLAAMLILIAYPAQLLDIGFQLSFLSIFAINFLSPLIKRMLYYENCKARALRVVLELFCSSAAAFIGLLPVIAWYFKIISPVAVLANIVIVPYVSLVTILGITFLFISALLPFATTAFALPAGLSATVLFAIVKTFNSMPFGYFYLR